MNPTVHYRKDYQAPHYQVISTYLTFDLKEHEAMVTNEMFIERAPDAPKDAPLILNGEEQELFTLKLDGKDVLATNYAWTPTELKIHKVPEKFTITTVSKIHPESNTKLEGLFRTQGYFCTQCEPLGFRRITFYLDRPDVMASFTTKIIADKKLYPVLLSNGNNIEKGEIDRHRHYAIWQDPFKKPSYLFALVAGNLAKISDHFITMSGRKVTLEIYTEPKFIKQAEFAMTAVKNAMRWDEERFGREYDLDIFMIVATEDFNMGAMENKGLNIFNTKYILASEATSTDKDYENVQAVVGHEYFHNWTGDRVTCRDWFQLSLKEGLTVFRESEFTADQYDRTIKRIEDVKIMRTSQFAEDQSPTAHPVRPDSYIEMNNFYTVTVYNKGCEVIRMQETLLGRAGFRKGMDLYFERFDGHAVTCDDFVQAMMDANGYDLNQFKLWYSQAGTPIVNVNGHYDAAKKTYTLELSQTCPATPGQDKKLPFYIPIKLGFISKNDGPLTFTYQGKTHEEIVLALKDSKETWVFTDIVSEPIPSLFRDFSAPVKVNFAISNDDLKILWAHDANLFNRWDAGQELLSRIFKALLADPKKTPKDFVPYIIEPIRELLTDSGLPPAFVAEAIQIPSIKAMAEQESLINPEALFATSEAFLSYISTELKDILLATYQRLNQDNKELLDQTAVGRRSLKNVCLAYLAQANQEGVTLAYQQFKDAKFMSDRLSALMVLVNSTDAPLKDQALNEFYERFKDEPLVVDKWFMVQASSKNKETLTQVQKLMQHPAFNIKNPNKVYNLPLAFCQNMIAFHDPQGLGYAFIKDVIKTLDALNPLVAARLVRAFMNYKRFSEPYQKLMHAQLEDLIKLPLSKDMLEIVKKSLA
jgi:aminopeptidase N